ncbi:Rieske 2Fe-2S domain-containing protein [Streptomyces sp. NPDC058122]|uniref:caspase, EACC1-associated type n=1 Tax=Streptomyces sp. NPDC058122 TaxID=3346349 RepID=UPI0036EB9F23
MRLPDPARSNAVLMGTGTYRSSAITDVPAVRGNLTDLTAVLSDSVSGSIPVGRCTVVPDPADARTACRALRKAADTAEDTLLVYFTGHGLVGARGELYLAMADTDPAELRVSGLEYDVLREVVSDCGADNRIVILDCCFSGRAAPALGTVLGQTAIEGTYVLASAPPNGVALAPERAAHTAFTGELIELLRNGVPDGPELLSLGEIYRRLLQAAVRRGLPRPVSSGSGTTDLLALVRNAASGPRVRQVPAKPGPTRRRTLASVAAVAVTGVGGGIGAWMASNQKGNPVDGRAGDRTSPGSTPAGTNGTPPSVTPTTGTSVTAEGAEDTPARRAIARTTDIPVGGGRIFAQEKVVVTQLEAGSFRALSAICTHAGCPVSTIRNREIGCPCHGSTFDIADGSVLDGPATTGLPSRVIEIRDDNVVLMADS